jgi:hypothetical protein
LFTTSFKVSTDSLTKFEQQFVLLLFAYMVLKFIVPQGRSAMAFRFPPNPPLSPQPLGREEPKPASS